jgi:hypothetical protein
MYSQSNWFYNQGRLNLHEEMYSYVFKCIFAIFSKFITESHWFYVENISSMSLYSIPFCHLLFKYFLLPLFILFLFFLRNHYREPVMSQWLYQQPTLDSSLLLRGWQCKLVMTGRWAGGSALQWQLIHSPSVFRLSFSNIRSWNTSIVKVLKLVVRLQLLWCQIQIPSRQAWIL